MSTEPKLFLNKVVLVTGASSGIGAGAAVRFASLGAKVVLTGRNAENLAAVAEKCDENGTEKALVIVADMYKDEDVKNIADSTMKHFGRLDILVNNAGILEAGDITTTNLEQYDRLFNINVRSVYHLTNLVVPHLIAAKGNIVNVSSVNGIRSFSGVLAYNMSKAAIDQFTRCTALELAPKQVRVNSVNPGVIITNIHKRSGMNEEQYKAFLERTKTTHALGRPGTVEEVVEMIVYLASDKAAFITGASIPIDGGRHAMCSR